jgi:uncharacterized protein YwqG
LCQIDLAQVANIYPESLLPKSGQVYFFYDRKQGTWGFDPKDIGAWKVIYSDEKFSDLIPTVTPADLGKDDIFKDKFIKLELISTYPDVMDECIDRIGLNDSQAEAYIEFCSAALGDNPEHHLFGYPGPIQSNDMDLECQLVSSGIYIGKEYNMDDPKIKALSDGRKDWRLLLQLDSDDEAGMMWGDGGRLYFWIKEDDLKQKNFDKCWMILQCG